MHKNETYIVVDIEADGPVPGLYSMLSLGAVATTKDKQISEFYKTIQPLEGASEHPRTMRWWAANPDAWEQVQQNAQPASVAIKEFVAWAQSLNTTLIFVSNPVGFDYPFISWYLQKFTNSNVFTNKNGGTNSLDLQSFIAGKFNLELKTIHLATLPDFLTNGMPKHTHNALDDAKGYAFILRNAFNKSGN